VGAISAAVETLVERLRLNTICGRKPGASACAPLPPLSVSVNIDRTAALTLFHRGLTGDRLQLQYGSPDTCVHRQITFNHF
jgi:hypothetical protein